jgi:AraC family transcriptional regulator
MELKEQQQSSLKKEVMNHEFPNFSLVETLYSPRATMPRHIHRTAHISILLQGSFSEKYGLKNRLNEPSTLILHPPNEDHSVTFQNSEARIFSIRVKTQFLERISDFTKILDSSIAIRDGFSALLAMKLYRESRETDEVSPLMYEALTLEIIAAVSRCKSLRERKTPRWLELTKEFLHAHFSETLTLEEIAKVADVHPIHLARVFRRQNGCSIGEYTRRLRVEFARRQISTTDVPLSEIALSAGFADQSHLARTFKSYLGITASEYRKISRNG